MFKKIIIAAVFLIIAFNVVGLERITIKQNQDRYTGNFVLLDKEKVVFLLFEQRFEFKLEEIEQIDFSGAEDEMEIVLDDNSVLKGSIVDQDEESYIFGSSAGLTTIQKVNVLQVRNPKYEEFYEKKVIVEEKPEIYFKTGVVPYTTWVLNDVAESFQAYWSCELFFETNLYSPVWFGLDTSFFMLYPTFEDFNGLLFFIPAHFYLKYQSRFIESETDKSFFNNLFWYIKIGAGAAPAIFTYSETEGESEQHFALSFSNAIELGSIYNLVDYLYIGICAKTDLIVQKNSYIITQSGGIICGINF